MELVKGDASETIHRYIEANPHTVVSLLYLDFDLYSPTKVALEQQSHRLPGPKALRNFPILYLNTCSTHK